MPTRGYPGTPRPTAGRPTEEKGIDALVTRLERLVTRLERTEERDAAMIRLLRVRLHYIMLRLAALDTAD